MRVLILSWAAWVCASGVAAAQEPSDSLFISGQIDFARASSGGAGSVEWLHETNRRGVQLGLLSGSRGEAWWTYGRAGGFLRRRRTVLSGTIDAGGGAQPASRFRYRRFDGQLSVPLPAGLTMFETEGQIAQMAADRRSVVRFGIRSVIRPLLTLSGSYYLVAFNGSLAPALSARIDIDRKPASLLAGFALARQQRTPTLLEQVGAVSLTSMELFAGCGFGRTSYRAQVVANLSPPPGNANRVLVSVRVPLRRRAEGSSDR